MAADVLADGAAGVALARSAGLHALPLFIAALLLLLAGACAVWWARRRFVVGHGAAVAPSPWRLAAGLAAGFGVIVAAAALFAEIAEGLRAQAVLGAADQAIADAVRSSVPDAALRFFAAVTRLADTATLIGLCLLVGLALLLAGRRWLAFTWVAAIAGNGLLNDTLKHVFERVRPLHDDGVVLAQGFSFPSGHSSGAVVAYGMLAYVATRVLAPRWHLAAWLAALVLAFTIGASRMFLRVHFASDVLAGFASGTAWLAVCIGSAAFGHWYRERRRQ